MSPIGINKGERMFYMILVGLENPIYAQILKCERSGQNLIFNNLEEADEKIKHIEARRNIKARTVAI